MGGAYVAKPDVVAPNPDNPPPGWNPNWPFPGPFPPGYVPEYTFPVTAPAVVKVGDIAAVAGSARDHATYITNEPDTAVLSAAIGGTDISLSPESVAFSEGAYWSIGDNVTFGITKSNEGQTIVLTATSAIGDEEIIGTASISIYEYEYSLVLSGPDEIEYDEAASVTVSLRDHDTLRSDSPGTATLTWTATLDGSAVGLKFSGDPVFGSSIESAYSDIGAYWGAEESIEFDLEEEDGDKTVTLKVESTVWGDEVSDTIEIDITKVYVVSFSASVVDNGLVPTGGYLGSAPRLWLRITRTPAPNQRDTAIMHDIVVTWDPATGPWAIEWNYDPVYHDEISENICTAGGLTLTASCASCVSGKIYKIAFLGDPGQTNYDLTEGDVTFTVTVVLSDDSEEVFSVVKHIESEGPNVAAQLLIDVDEAELTWSED